MIEPRDSCTQWPIQDLTLGDMVNAGEGGENIIESVDAK